MRYEMYKRVRFCEDTRGTIRRERTGSGRSRGFFPPSRALIVDSPIIIELSPTAFHAERDESSSLLNSCLGNNVLITSLYNYNNACVYKILHIGYLHEREHRQTELFADSINDRSSRVDGISLDFIPSTSCLQKMISSAGSRIRIDGYLCESSHSAVLSLLRSTFFSLSHVSCRTRVRERSNGKIDWRRWRVNNRRSRGRSAARGSRNEGTHTIIRDISFYLRISH